MFEVRVHGRGGQGVVTAAELLSVAAFLEGRHAQAFPSFGSERTGAPVVAYCRIADREIRTHAPIVLPDAVIVQDPTLLGRLPVLDGLRQDGLVLVNSTKDIALEVSNVFVVPATEIAQELVGRPVPNAALLGGFSAASGLVSLASVSTAIRERFAGKIAEANVAAATRAFEIVRAKVEERQHA
ncbi:MAG: 2-oxoacid:acceptor oxidoreductase [Actinophytocola sp.]|uniref:2-oxoacid:acceptor oxidoreductase family protein n=1 Tax=Actinophytocola sp. TaxID=1872138 RepID=UPI001329F940|nr:2-oxoacid:acceptor oxidoreductase family protein [Actinophytocola sp.]MPZ79039.1 2-oxoacid:acceptor oxidoreductase [Actinophytocola sp.]